MTHQAAYSFNDDPTTPFDTRSNYTNESNIRWTPVDNVQAVCEKESRKRGFNGFGYPLNACTFFDGNKCYIFTSKQTTLHTLGHEVRHCFQGNWH
jgi:hypothetical protein